MPKKKRKKDHHRNSNHGRSRIKGAKSQSEKTARRLQEKADSLIQRIKNIKPPENTQDDCVVQMKKHQQTLLQSAQVITQHLQNHTNQQDKINFLRQHAFSSNSVKTKTKILNQLSTAYDTQITLCGNTNEYIDQVLENISLKPSPKGAKTMGHHGPQKRKKNKKIHVSELKNQALAVSKQGLPHQETIPTDTVDQLLVYQEAFFKRFNLSQYVKRINGYTSRSGRNEGKYGLIHIIKTRKKRASIVYIFGGNNTEKAAFRTKTREACNVFFLKMAKVTQAKTVLKDEAGKIRRHQVCLIVKIKLNLNTSSLSVGLRNICDHFYKVINIYNNIYSMSSRQPEISINDEQEDDNDCITTDNLRNITQWQPIPSSAFSNTLIQIIGDGAVAVAAYDDELENPENLDRSYSS